MIALKEPILESYGMCYIPRFTEEFEKLIETAKDKVFPFLDKEESDIPHFTYYFKVKEEEVSSEYDCCDNAKCINASKQQIRQDYGKYTRVEESYYSNDGDKEALNHCFNCNRYLSEWLTWGEDEFSYLEEEKENWSSEFFKSNAFLIHSLLQSMPTMDNNISGYDKHQSGIGNKKPLEERLKRREAFFQRVGELANQIINNL